jgi:hypothetical protein
VSARVFGHPYAIDATLTHRFSLPGEKKKLNAGAMIRYIKEIEHQRREELGICFEAWLAGGGYFPPFRSIRAAPSRAAPPATPSGGGSAAPRAPPAAPGGGHNWGGGRVLGGR